MNATELDKGPGRLQIRADERNLTPYAGLAVSGELVRGLGLVGLLDAELAAVRRAAPVKRRRRGLSAGALLVALAEAQLVGAECFDDLEDLRADRAGAPLRAVAATPSASRARQLARLYRRSHLQAAERALARAGGRLDRALGRDPGEPVTLDLDATEVEVYGRKKHGARRGRGGALACCPYVVTWAERGRALASELEPGNRAKISAAESLRLLTRAERLVPAGHGPVSVRGDVGFYAAELMAGLRRRGIRFSFSAPRTATIWAKLAEIPEQAWQEAVEMHGAQVAELAFTPTGWQQEPLRLIVRRVPVSAAELEAGSPKARRRSTIPPGQLALVLEGQLDSTFAYSFIVSDIPAADKDTIELEHFHRRRAQIEERLKEAKLGQALRHLPSGDLNANRLWLQAALTALTLNAMLCDLSPALRAAGRPGASLPIEAGADPLDEQKPSAPGHRRRKERRRRAAKTLRWLLFCLPARVARRGRRTILHLQAGLRHAHVVCEAYEAAYALAPP